MSNERSKHGTNNAVESEIDTESRLFALESAFLGLANALTESGVLQTSLLTRHLQAEADECDRLGDRGAGEHLDLLTQCLDPNELSRARPAVVPRSRDGL